MPLCIARTYNDRQDFTRLRGRVLYLIDLVASALPPAWKLLVFKELCRRDCGVAVRLEAAQLRCSPIGNAGAYAAAREAKLAAHFGTAGGFHSRIVLAGGSLARLRAQKSQNAEGA